MSEYPENQAPTPVAEDYPMKWHKFLIYFALWASGILNIIQSFQYFTGSVYQGNEDAVYRIYPGMKSLDLVMGVMLIVIGVLALVTRFALAGYKEKGPKLLIVLYGMNLVVPIVYLLIASSITGISMSELAGSSVWGSMIGSIIMIIANRIYYNKRSSLFVN